jgi:hypothetical protein
VPLPCTVTGAVTIFIATQKSYRFGKLLTNFLVLLQFYAFPCIFTHFYAFPRTFHNVSSPPNTSNNPHVAPTISPVVTTLGLIKQGLANCQKSNTP